MRDPSDLADASLRPDSLPKAGLRNTALSGGVPPPSAPPVVRRLKRRADFLHAGKGKRWHGKTLSLHAAPARSDGADPAVVRIGYTLTKKVGNAVVRNRARRRLKEAVRLCADLPAKPGHDYVIVGRLDAVRLPFAVLGRDVVRAIGDVHGGRGASRRSGDDKVRDAKFGDAKFRDAKSRDVKSRDANLRGVKPHDTKSRDTKPHDTRP